MTNAEINRRVAEACGYAVEMFYGHTTVHGQQKLWDPRHDANQAIEALDRVFYQWIIYTTDAPLYPDQKITVKGKMAGEWYTGQGETTCAAACNAILATQEPR